MTYNPPVLPPYSTDTFTVCKLHTSILTYFGRIAIFFVKNPGKGMGIPFFGGWILGGGCSGKVLPYGRREASGGRYCHTERCGRRKAATETRFRSDRDVAVLSSKTPR